MPYARLRSPRAGAARLSLVLCIQVCDAAADCDDDLFCNGAELCVDGVCFAGEEPCGVDPCNKGSAANDGITGGDGVDRFFSDATAQFGDTLIDFTGGTDKIGLASGIINFAGVAGTEAAPVALSAANFETTRTAVAFVSAGDAAKIVCISAEQTTAQIVGDAGAPAAAYVLVLDSTIDRGVLYYDADWSNAAGQLLVIRFENITTNAAVQALTFTDFEEID